MFRFKRMSKKTAIELLEKYNAKYDAPYQFVRILKHDQDGVLALCKLKDGTPIEVCIFPDMIMPVPEHSS